MPKTPKSNTSDYLVSCMYEYLSRIVGEEESKLIQLHRKTNLSKMDSVDIIDLIETRVRYETLCEVEHNLYQILSWRRFLDN